LVIEVVALARALAHPREARNAAVLLGDVVDQLLDEHRLADAGAAEQARLAALRVRLEQVDDLDARLEHLDLRRLLVERRRRPVARIRLLGVDGGRLARLELDVDDRPDDLDDLPRAHASAPCLSASAPPTMSSSSLVIFSWRALLYWIVRISIMSFAFLVAASMAVMRAPYSPASDSISARNTCMRT